MGTIPLREVLARIRGRRPMGNIKINSDSKTICTGCRRAMVIADDTLQQRIYCNAADIWLKTDVNACSKFDDANQPTEEDMRKVAYYLDPSKRKIGFDQSAWVAPGTKEHNALRRKDGEYVPD